MTSPISADEQLRLNPHVPLPPFSWYISIPENWALLDTNPTSWQRNAARLVDERFSGKSLKAADRRGVLGFLEQLVAECQRAGAAMSLIQLGRMSSGSVGSAGLHVAWFNSGRRPASLALAREALSRSGVAQEIETPIGSGLLHTDEMFSTPPGLTTRVRSLTLQAYLPIPDSHWTAVLSAATPHAEMHAVLGEVTRSVLKSIRPTSTVVDPSGGQEESTTAEHYRAVAKSENPGIEKGFGTMLRRRADGLNPDA